MKKHLLLIVAAMIATGFIIKSLHADEDVNYPKFETYVAANDGNNSGPLNSRSSGMAMDKKGDVIYGDVATQTGVSFGTKSSASGARYTFENAPVTNSSRVQSVAISKNGLYAGVALDSQNSGSTEAFIIGTRNTDDVAFTYTPYSTGLIILGDGGRDIAVDDAGDIGYVAYNSSNGSYSLVVGEISNGEYTFTAYTAAQLGTFFQPIVVAFDNTTRNLGIGFSIGTGAGNKGGFSYGVRASDGTYSFTAFNSGSTAGIPNTETHDIVFGENGMVAYTSQLGLSIGTFANDAYTFTLYNKTSIDSLPIDNLSGVAINSQNQIALGAVENGDTALVIAIPKETVIGYDFESYGKAAGISNNNGRSFVAFDGDDNLGYAGENSVGAGGLSSNVAFAFAYHESNTPPSPSKGNKKLTGGDIAGITIGSIAAVGIVAGGAIFFGLKRKKTS